jgi:hypothetical protein
MIEARLLIGVSQEAVGLEWTTAATVTAIRGVPYAISVTQSGWHRDSSHSQLRSGSREVRYGRGLGQAFESSSQQLVRSTIASCTAGVR